MYDKHQHQIKWYLNYTFQVGMTTTKNSESMNVYFDRYMQSNTMLNDFVVQYDKAVHTRRAVEEKKDFQTMNRHATLSGTHPIDKVARDRNTQHV